VEPTAVNCWDEFIFNPATCVWDNVGVQDPQPVLECWESAEFNTATCQWDVTSNPFTVNVSADLTVCYEGTAVFDFTGGPAAGTVVFTLNGTQQTVVLDGAGEYTLTIDSATVDLTVVLISVSNGTCVIDTNLGSATIDVGDQITTSGIFHD
jgi:hypothetical protein